MFKRLLFFQFLIVPFSFIYAQKAKSFTLNSPDTRLKIIVTINQGLRWEVSKNGESIIQPSVISMQLANETIPGLQPKLLSSKTNTVDQQIIAVAYKKKMIRDHYNELVLNFKGDYTLIFRAYDEGAAYRFKTVKKERITVQSENAEFNFERDHTTLIPFTSDLRDGERYSCSFEEFYTSTPISAINKDTLGYLPLMVSISGQRKVVLLEADVQDYPGMFIQANPAVNFGLKASFAPYPLEERLGIRSKINYLATKRAGYIAQTNGTRNFPWRIILISDEDKELLNNDIVQKLSQPNQITDPSWIKPGKVAWDWWNDWNISHVDFKAGINTPTYKYYIDFASANHIEYIVLDEGWSDDWDLNILKPNVELKELVEYGRQKSTGLILWTTWYAFSRDIEGLCKKYSELGIRGFKVDFLDRNDQKMISSAYEMAAIAAKYHLLLDFHGMFPPQGLVHTWPNVINFEGVRGMEYSKWSADERVPAHELNLPFIRMVAGPMDYTPGAMRNVTKGNARPSNSLPVSQGTRCHQMAMYVIYEAPLEMLADNPTIYMKEQESTSLISSIPTTFDETTALDGKVGEYAVIARKKDDAWYVAAMTNWETREVDIDLSFLGEGNYQATIFKDGINADKDATDYKKETINVTAGQHLQVSMKSGGGWIAVFKKN